MVGKAGVAVKVQRTAQSFKDDRENREKWIGLMVWMIVMILATMAGFGIGYASSNWF